MIGIHQQPRQLHPVVPRIEGRVAFDAILEQGLVRLRRSVAECLFVLEVKFERTDTDLGSRRFDFERKRHAFVGLDPDHQYIGSHVVDRAGLEQQQGRPLELDGNFGHASEQPFTGSQIKGHSFPAPVVDQKFHGRVGGRRRISGDVGLFAITRHRFTVDSALDRTDRAPRRPRLDRRLSDGRHEAACFFHLVPRRRKSPLAAPWP